MRKGGRTQTEARERGRSFPARNFHYQRGKLGMQFSFDPFELATISTVWAVAVSSQDCWGGRAAIHPPLRTTRKG